MTDLDDFDTYDGGLAFWHPVNDVEIDETYLPWGPVAPGSSADVRVRVRNDSDDYIAADITVTTAGPVDPGDPDASAQHLLSLDGHTFALAVILGDLPPNATSDPIWLRRITAADATPGAEALFTLTATADSWIPAVPTADADPSGVAPSVGDAYDPAAAEPLVEDPEEQMP